VDLRHFFSVLRRFWYIALVGFLLAVGLTFLSMFKVDSHRNVTYRAKEQWVSYATLFVTQKGFPWGRLPVDSTGASTTAAPAAAAGAGLATRSTAAAASSTSSTPQQAPAPDLGRLASLAVLYANLASGDAVRAIMLEKGPIVGRTESAPVSLTPGSNDVLPLISIAAISPTPAAAEELANREAAALQTYLKQQQKLEGTPPTDRVVLQLVSRADSAKVFATRSKTLPVVLFLTVIMATLGLTLVLENLRPRPRPAPAQAPPAAADAA